MVVVINGPDASAGLKFNLSSIIGVIVPSKEDTITIENKEIETIFLMSSDKNSFISSNLVKEVHKLGGDVSSFVSDYTINILNSKNST